MKLNLIKSKNIQLESETDVSYVVGLGDICADSVYAEFVLGKKH